LLIPSTFIYDIKLELNKFMVATKT